MVGFGLAYSLFSEWLNFVVRKSWAYSEMMPVVPGIDTGLSPLPQWLTIPVIGLLTARRVAHGRTRSRSSSWRIA